MQASCPWLASRDLQPWGQVPEPCPDQGERGGPRRGVRSQGRTPASVPGKVSNQRAGGLSRNIPCLASITICLSRSSFPCFLPFRPHLLLCLPEPITRDAHAIIQLPRTFLVLFLFGFNFHARLCLELTQKPAIRRRHLMRPGAGFCTGQLVVLKE